MSARQNLASQIYLSRPTSSDSVAVEAVASSHKFLASELEDALDNHLAFQQWFPGFVNSLMAIAHIWDLALMEYELRNDLCTATYSLKADPTNSRC